MKVSDIARVSERQHRGQEKKSVKQQLVPARTNALTGNALED